MTENASELQFIEPTAEAFLTALRNQLPLTEPIQLVGHGDLADAIVEKSVHEGITIVAHEQAPPFDVLKKTQTLLFTETHGERLGQLLLDCLKLQHLRIFAPISDWHISRKPLFIVSIPKAGTHLAYELAKALGYSPGIEMPDFPEPGSWYCLEFSNSHTVARDFFVDSVRRAPFGNRHHPITQSPVLFVYRHPLDILVSEAHYYHLDGKTAFAGYFSGDDFEQRVRRLVDDKWLLGSLRQRVGGFLPWLNFPNVIPASFEELVGDAGGGSTALQLELIWSIQLKLQAGGVTKDIAAQIFKRDSATFREGQIGGYRSQLPQSLLDELTEQCYDILAGFGYSPQTNSIFSALIEQHASRPLQYSTMDFNRTPVTVERDFMRCNLVRYCRRFYAVPLSAGTIALDKLESEQLARLPSAKSLAELKSVLLIGRTAYDHQVTQLCELGKALSGKISNKAYQAYWSEAEEPTILQTYKGFNLVAFKGRYFALKQSCGAIDLSQDLWTLMSRYSPDDVLMARHLDSLLDDIDGISTAARLASNKQREIKGSQVQFDNNAHSIPIQQGQLNRTDEINRTADEPGEPDEQSGASNKKLR